MYFKRRQQKKLFNSFFASLRDAFQCALLLDYDGTLAPFRVNPEEATPYPGIRKTLNAILKGQHTRVVLISGRWIKDLVPLLSLKQLPEIWGSHGWERLMPDGAYHIAKFDDRALRGLAEADSWVEREGLGDRSEQKPGCLALHWRGLEQSNIEKIRDRILKRWSRLAQEAGLTLSEFDGGIELRVPGRDKGHAVQAILAEMGQGTVAAYLGDDVTDEDAFQAIQGKGLGILVRNKFRPTAAEVWLKPPRGLLKFLSRWHKTRGGVK